MPQHRLTPSRPCSLVPDVEGSYLLIFRDAASQCMLPSPVSDEYLHPPAEKPGRARDIQESYRTLYKSFPDAELCYRTRYTYIRILHKPPWRRSEQQVGDDLLRLERSTTSAKAHHMQIGSTCRMPERLQRIGDALRVDHAGDEDETGTMIVRRPSGQVLWRMYHVLRYVHDHRTGITDVQQPLYASPCTCSNMLSQTPKPIQSSGLSNANEVDRTDGCGYGGLSDRAAPSPIVACLPAPHLAPEPQSLSEARHDNACCRIELPDCHAATRHLLSRG